MTNLIAKPFGAVLFSAVVLSGAQGEITVLSFQQGAGDYAGTTVATAYEENPTFANGGNDELQVGRTGSTIIIAEGARVRGAIRFDLTSVPAGAVVMAATLELTVSGASAGGPGTTNQAIHPILKDWGEGTVNSGNQGALANPGDMTWDSNKHGSETWTNPGGDIGPSSATAVVGGSGTIRWSSTAMAGTVSGWLSAPESNHGWMVVGDESGILRTGRRFRSSENLSVADRPKLLLEVEVENSEVQGWFLY